MSDCLDAQCSPVPSQAFPSPLPPDIPADTITYAFEGVCPTRSGLDPCQGAPISVAKALDLVETKLCTLNPKGISQAPDCSPLIVRGGVATPVSPMEALNCLPKTKAGDVPIFNGTEWVIGPILLDPPDCEYPCPPAPNLVLTSTGPNTATWQTPSGGASLAVTDTPTVDLTLANGSLSADVKVDPDPNNALKIGTNGLTVSAPTVGVTDTPTVDLQKDTSGIISATVIVDPVPGNRLIAGATGLKVDPLDCSTLRPLIDPSSPTTCYPALTDSPAKILSTGPAGIGFRNFPALSAGESTTVSDTSTLDLTLTGSNITGVVKVDPSATNAITVTPNGLSVVIPPAAALNCAALTPLLDPASATTCYPTKSDAPVSVLSTGTSGLGYRPLPSGSAPSTTSVVDSTSIDFTATTAGTNTSITGVVKIDPVAGNLVSISANGLVVPDPLTCANLVPLIDGTSANTCLSNKSDAITRVLSQGASGVGYRTIAVAGPSGLVTATDSSSIDFTVTGTDVTGIVKVDPVAGNKLSSGANGLLVGLPTCPEVLQFASPTTAATPGCIPSAGACVLPNALMGHTGGTPSYYAGKPLYHAEAYPLTTSTQQTLSTVGSTLNDITSLMTIAAGDENGLCAGEASFWDPALSRFTITRPGRYTVHFGVFIRAILSNSTAVNNGSLYAGIRFIRPSGTVNGRTVSSQANTLRGTQFPWFTMTAPGATIDMESTGSHTFIATSGTQLSLRVVAIMGSAQTITSLIVRGDSGHFSLSELPDRQF